jgi:hypothetical protein
MHSDLKNIVKEKIFKGMPVLSFLLLPTYPSCNVPENTSEHTEKEHKKISITEQEKKDLIKKAELGDAKSLREVLELLFFNHHPEHFDVVLAMEIYTAAVKNNPEIINHPAIKPILSSIPILQMASEAGNLDVTAVADGFFFDSPFHSRLYLNVFEEPKFTHLPEKFQKDSFGYMAKKASISNEFGIPSPKLIFQLVLRFLITAKRDDDQSPGCAHAFNTVKEYYDAWKKNVVIPFYPDFYYCMVETRCVEAFELPGKLYDITEKIVKLSKHLPLSTHQLLQEAYQNALIFLKGKIFAEDFGGPMHPETRMGDFVQAVEEFYENLYGNLQCFFSSKKDVKMPIPDHFFMPDELVDVDPQHSIQETEKVLVTKEDVVAAENMMNQAFKELIAIRHRTAHLVYDVGQVDVLQEMQKRFKQLTDSLCELYRTLSLVRGGTTQESIDIWNRCRFYLLKKRIKKLCHLKNVFIDAEKEEEKLKIKNESKSNQKLPHKA